MKTQQAHVLYADDDEDDLEIFSIALGKVYPNIELMTVRSGVAVLDLLNSSSDEPPAMIFLDFNMPVMNGIECLREIRRTKNHDQINIWLYSTTLQDHYLTEIKGLNSSYLVKPHSIDDLIIELTQIFKTEE
jgi:CheY-like chemotaxis protein